MEGDLESRVTRSQAIKRFLDAKTRPHLAALYSDEYECQVNVGQFGGERVDSKEFTHSISWTDNVQTWYPFRIPKNAMSEPEDNSGMPMTYELDKYVEAIGMTGWNWKKRKSMWVAFDFDAIAGHSDKHAATLSDAQLNDVREAAMAIPWITVQKSTGGKGLHLYVFLDGIDSQNHNEHAALARSIIALMSAKTGFDFQSGVDVCGGNMWVWGRKMEGTDGLTLVKKGDVLYDVPPNWKEHIKVTSSRGKMRNLPHFIPSGDVSLFEELAGQRPKIQLDDDHRKLIDFLTETKAHWWWDTDHWMLVCHTYDLARAHEQLTMKGAFHTLATGRHAGGDHNCFCFPIRRGAWSVRRYTRGIQEHSSWGKDTSNFTFCYLNRDPDLKTVARTYEATELENNGGFEFQEAEIAQTAVKLLGVTIDLPNHMARRTTILKPNKDGRLIVKIRREDGEKSPGKGWKEDTKQRMWVKIFDVNVVDKQEPEAANYDDVVRHLVSEMGDDCGWVIKANQSWNVEPLAHVKAVLGGAMSLNEKQVREVIGVSVARCWRLVNMPFKPEYPGDRQWNRNSAQLRFMPTAELDNLTFPHWRAILSHTGSGLDDAVSEHKWCKTAGIMTGGDYLCYWISSLFKNPLKPLPYLFFYGPQNSGKSILPEALALLFDRKRGVIRADAALISPSGFNGELENAVLGVVEETDFSRNPVMVYNRVKDWVTSPDILIHRKNQTPYTTPNSLHIIHVSNPKEACPVFKDDTRITMGFVKSLEPGQEIAKDKLTALLEKEAPDFLAYILALEIPETGTRMGVPIIETVDKLETAKANQSVLEMFISECCHRVDGEAVKLGDLYQKFKDWLDPNEAENWTKPKMSKELPPDLPKGRFRGADWHIGNLSFTPKPLTEGKRVKLVARGEFLKPENEANG